MHFFLLEMNQESLEEKGKKKRKKKPKTKIPQNPKPLGKTTESSLNTGLEFPLYQSGICFTTENKS